MRVVDYYSQVGFTADNQTDRVRAMAADIVMLLGEQREAATTVNTILSAKAPGVPTIDPAASIQDTIRLMIELRIGAIVASTDGSRIEGILSEWLTQLDGPMATPKEPATH